MKNKKINKSLVPYISLLSIALVIFIVFLFTRYNHKSISYSELLKNINENKIEEIEVTPNQKNSIYVITGRLKGAKEYDRFVVKTPLSDNTLNELLVKNDKKELKYNLVIKNDTSKNELVSVLLNFGPIVVLLVLAGWFITSQLQSGAKGLDFGKSTAKLSTKPKFKFKDVAGLKEEKEEVEEMIDFLRNPKKFKVMGARIPKGFLLVGPPGTGKTLLAKAVAGEAGVPFFYMSGSDFLELYVGVGASRVRDLFKEAKKAAPCLIFIDEIDTIGRRRGSGNGGGHDEREQTLNQLLSEMDGFEDNEGVIVIGATNRADVLDPALLRAGRFDRQVTVDLPNKDERFDILKVHAKNKVLANEVDLKNIAARTPGFSGADLENVLNEGALLAVRRNKDQITMLEIDEATDRVIGGPSKNSKKYTDHEKKVVAYHEAGHAVIGIKLKDAEQVHKITIIPRGDAGGYTLMLPKEEKYLATKNELLERIVGLFGGRASEEIYFEDVTTGAHNDFEKATKIARSIVTEYGMSKLGPVQYEHRSSGYYLGEDTRVKNYSDHVALEIDQEVQNILQECYEKAKKIIKENDKLLKLLANTLLDKETLNKEEIDSLVETGKLPEAKEEVKEETEKVSKKVTKNKKGE